jgi:lipopolysaccharide assembly outer membrane protein LptD (OstA)
MKRFLGIAIVLVAAAAPCFGQLKLDSDAITRIQIKGAKEVIFNTDKEELESIEKGTVILHSKNPENNLTLITDLLTCEYDGDDDRLPSKFTMKGNVSIDSAQIKITSENCDIDMIKNAALFKGNVRYVMKGRNAVSGVGSVVEVDMNLGKIRIVDPDMDISLSEPK